MRKVIFWTHLACGVVAGLVILMMSATGVILTYERQIIGWANRDNYHDPSVGETLLPIDALLASAQAAHPEFVPTSLTLSANSQAPAAVSAGRSGTKYVNRYTGAVLEESAPGLRGFFSAVTGWHRWFNATGENRGVARAITGASNLAFLFLVLSGGYLWLPKIWKWPAFKTRLVFNAKATSSKARDFNWHHVLGIWTFLPLAVVVATAVVFSYGWANNLVYSVFGEEAPGRGGGEESSEAPSSNIGHRSASLDELTDEIAKAVPDWQSLTLLLPPESSPIVRFSLDRGNGGQPHLRHDGIIDAYTAQLLELAGFDDRSPGRRARSWIRFLHTGEALGLAGQTIAGLVSLTSVIMVWTGLALAYRRLIGPLIRRRREG